MTSVTPVLLTLQEVAELLQVPRGLVRDRVYAGAWPHVRILSRNRRMTREQVDQVIEMLSHAPVRESRSDAHRRREYVRSLIGGL